MSTGLPWNTKPAVIDRRYKDQIEHLRACGESCAKIHIRGSEAMTGIQFVTDDKGRKTAVLIDLKKHGRLWEDFWDGLVSESRRKEKSVPYQEYRANRTKHGRPYG
jgi:hypothetical protein